MTLQLNIEIVTEGTSKTVTFYPKITELGDNYQQVVGHNMANTRVDWTLATSYMKYSDLNAIVATINNLFAGDVVDIDISERIGLLTVLINSYSIEYDDDDEGRLILECVQVSGGEYKALSSLLPIADIPTRLIAVSNHIWNNKGDNTSSSVYQTYSPTCDFFPKSFIAEQTYDLSLPYQAGNLRDNAAIALALIESYSVSGNTQAFNIGLAVINSVLSRLYTPGTPTSPDDLNFYAHWALLVRGDINTKSPVRPLPENSGIFPSSTSAIAFTYQSEGVYKSNIADLADVYKITVQNYGLSGLYVYAPYMNPADEVKVLYWIDKYNLKVTKNSVTGFITFSSNDTLNVPGDVVVNLTSAQNCRVVHSVFDTVGLANYQRVEGFPFFRPPLSGETTIQTAAFAYLYDCYDRLREYTLNTAWDIYKSASAAVFSNFVRTYSQNETIKYDIFKPEPLAIGGDSPYIGIGQGRFTYNSAGYSLTISRSNPDGYYEITVSGMTQIVYQEAGVRNTSVFVDWDTDTRLKVRLKSTINQVVRIYLSTDETNFRALDELYFAPVYLVANTWTEFNLKYLDFVRFYSNEISKTIWHPTQRSTPLIGYGDSATAPSWTYLHTTVNLFYNEPRYPVVLEVTLAKLSGQQTGVYLNNSVDEYSTVLQMPEITMKLVSGNIVIYLLDANDNLFYTTTTVLGIPTGSWVKVNVPTSLLYATIPGTIFQSSQPIKRLYFQLDTASTSGVFQLYLVGNEPDPVPVSTRIYETSIGTRATSSHTITIDYLRVENTANIFLPYTNGVLPPYINKLGTSFRGLQFPRVDNQSLYLMEKFGMSEKTNVLNFYQDAAKDLTSRSGVYQTKGLFTPVFRWESYINHPDYPTNTWQLFNTCFPTIRTDDMNMQYYAVLDIAKAWAIDKANISYKQLVEDFLDLINHFWSNEISSTADTGNAPNQLYVDTGSNVRPLLDAGFKNVHGSALCLQIGIYANLAGGDRLQTLRLITRAYSFLNSQYVSTGGMAGTWTKDKPTAVSYSGTAWKQINTIEYAEVIRAYVLLCKQRVNLRYPSRAAWDSLFYTN
jgi:hypothetical protein